MIGGILKRESFRAPFSLFSSVDVPERLIVKPIDPWPGDAAEGLTICDESHDLRAGHLSAWPERLHRFFWLRDLRTLGGEEARHCARDMIVQWTDAYGFKPKTPDQKLAWRPDILGERISNWISHYDFIDACHLQHDEDFEDVFFESLYAQARVLSGTIASKSLHDLPALKALKGFLYAGLAFEEHEEWAEVALSLLEKQIAVQFLADGSHISRSPLELLRGLQILLDIKSALAAAAYPLPHKIQHAIDRAGPALKFFRYNDHMLATMNGSFEQSPAFIDSVLAQAGVRGRPMNSLPCSGYERLSMGRTTILFDCGNPPKAPHDQAAHAAPLSFELSYGKDRVFVSCGSHYTDADWSECLRATAAHSALVLDQRNAYEIRPDGHFSRKALAVSSERHEADGAILVQGSHDGYLPMNGVIHSRTLYLSDKGYDLRGEDVLSAKIKPAKPIDLAIRFHLHPRAMVSLSQDHSVALVRLPNGIGWRFEISAGVLEIEDSIYLGDGHTVRKTKQIVIHGQTVEKQSKINWRFHREGV